jgi:hypothetical protein
MDDVVVATFNPWLFKGRDELVIGFFNALRNAIGRSRSERARDVVKWIDRYWGAVKFAGHGVSAAVDLFGGGGAATAALNKWEPHIRSSIVSSPPRSPEEERMVLETKIEEAKFAAVVLIDELDRVEDDEVRAVAQLVKAVGEIKGLSYLVAFDAERVIMALGRGDKEERRISGERYLEKIVQHIIPLRPLFSEDAKILLLKYLNEYSLTLPVANNEDETKIMDCLVDYMKTPRDVKRLVGAYSVIWRMVLDEINPYDVLAYCWIITKSPMIRDQIAENIDDLVVDPGLDKLTDSVIRRMNKEAPKGLKDMLGDGAIEHEKLFRLLFPSIFRIDSDGDGARLSRRRNLIRMLYLGNPPGAPNRADIFGLWGETNLEKLEHALRAKIGSGKFGAILDRLDDWIVQLPQERSGTFWIGVSKALTRQSDWLSGPEVERGLGEDVATILYRLAQRDPVQMPAFNKILGNLIDAGDFCIVPYIALKNIFALGLTDPPQTAKGGELYEIQSATRLIDSEMARYRAAVLDGTILRRVPRPDALICLGITKKIDSQSRQALTDQLNEPKAIWTLAGLMVPPGYFVEKPFFDTLFDTDDVKNRIDHMLSNSQIPSDGWLMSSIRRLHSILSNEDPDR